MKRESPVNQAGNLKSVPWTCPTARLILNLPDISSLLPYYLCERLTRPTEKDLCLGSVILKYPYRLNSGCNDWSFTVDTSQYRIIQNYVEGAHLRKTKPRDFALWFNLIAQIVTLQRLPISKRKVMHASIICTVTFEPYCECYNVMDQFRISMQHLKL